jgi:hypothetical protein
MHRDGGGCQEELKRKKIHRGAAKGAEEDAEKTKVKT